MRFYRKEIILILLVCFEILVESSGDEMVSVGSQGEEPRIGIQKKNDIRNVEMTQNIHNNTPNSTQNWECPCLNEGSCYSPKQNHIETHDPSNTFCHCQQNYIGSLCQQKANYLPVESDIYQLIRTTKYKYFYYQPKQENAYSFSFHICFSEADQDVTNYTNSQRDIMEKAITFFFTIEHYNGTLELNETQNQPQTIILYQDQCKHIYADYTTFEKTKTQQIQKLVLAIKLGYKLGDVKTNMIIYSNNNVSDSQKKNNTLKYNLDSQIMDKNNYKLMYIIDSQKNKRYTKDYLQIQLNNNTTRLVYIDFDISALSVEEVMENILYSLATIIFFFIVGGLLFLLRTKILGLSLNESLNPGHGLANNIKHFEKFMPPESFRVEREPNVNTVITDEEGLQCAICLFAFKDGENVRTTPCDHVFHKSCIDSWCLQNLTCPICRRSLTQKNLKQIDQPSLLEIRTNSDSNDQL